MRGESSTGKAAIGRAIHDGPAQRRCSIFESKQVRAMLPKMKEMGIYEPNRDSVITPINGEEGSRGYALGQKPLNQELSLIFNPQTTNPRFIIDGGRDRKQFAVGDKVMATKNDWESGITNGMTGIIVDISDNAEYSGDRRRFGLVDEVNAYFRDHADEAEHVELDLDSLNESMEAQDRGKEKAKESGNAARPVISSQFDSVMMSMGSRFHSPHCPKLGVL
jgi:hypothetical protein